MTHHTSIGLALIVKNEERNIEACINSCKGVDEVAVVDTGSSDKTVEIARSLGATVDVETFRWPDPPDYTGIDFSAARNRSVDMLNTEWFLFLDADERLDKGHIWNIRRRITELRDPFKALLVTMYTEKGDTFWRDKVMKKCPETRFVGRVHEATADEVLYADLAKDIRIHYQTHPHSPRNYAILREECAADPNSMRLQYLMGREEFCWGNVPSSIYWFERWAWTYERSGKYHPMRAADAYFTLGYAYARMAEYARARTNAGKALIVNPDFKEAAQLLADLAGFEGNGMAQERWLGFAGSAENRGLGIISKCFQQECSPEVQP